LHVVSRKRLVEAAAKHPQLGQPLYAWYRIAKRAKWRNLMDVRREFPSAEAVWKFTVFNIKGNAYRLIKEVNYRTGRVFLRHVVTHASTREGTGTNEFADGNAGI
jgi:mRNA interferase HigB